MTDPIKTNIDVSLVRRLITTQFPHWADLPITPIEFSGWDNRTFHLGGQMSIRMPSAEVYSGQVEKEHHWLPKLASHLPLTIPIPLAMGEPTVEYPWHWSIYKWLNGKAASIGRITDMVKFAAALAEFLVALQKIDITNGPMAGKHNFYRGGPLTTYDAETRQAIVTLGDKTDVKAVTEVWNAAIASSWHGAPVWVHGDITIGNLLLDEDGQLSAVIDFGQLGIGDPACDLVIAWTLFKGESRDAFREAMRFDNATWARARGWALWKALIVCAALPGTNNLEIEKSRLVIDEVLADHRYER